MGETFSLDIICNIPGKLVGKLVGKLTHVPSLTQVISSILDHNI